jgi:shikimate dehydrogenase
VTRERAAGRHRFGIEGTTRVIGIFGDPVEHSLSPRMHNAAFRSLGLDYVYVPFHPAARTIREAVMAIRALGLVGVNVTVPFKRDVMQHLDRVSATAKAVGAVNTIVRRGMKLFGENTDVPGFAAALRAGRARARGARVLVIGAGGAARAVLHALLEAGAAEIAVANRTRSRAAELCRSFGRSGRKLNAVGLDALADRGLLGSRTLVVNSTSVGLEGGAFLAYDAGATPRACVHFDLAYREGLTPFLTLARAARRPLVDGRHMLLHQGAIAFTLFTGKTAPLPAMARAIGLLGVRSRRDA